MSKLLIFLLLGISSSLMAHEIRPGLLTLEQVSELKYQVEFKQPQVQGRFLNLSFQTNCDSVLGDARTSSTALLETFQMTCTEPLIFIEIAGLEGTLVDTMVTITALSGDKQNFLVTSREPRIETANGTAIPVYFVLGIQHLIFGLDHVLFVFLLFYLVSGWKNLLKVVTSFTVAHSITLGLSAFNLVSVSQGPIEALIALSIVLLALEVLTSDKEGSLRQHLWLVAFTFGLLHGLGFASALAEIGLPSSSAVTALLLFNVGLEIGQILVLIAALILANVVTRRGIQLSHPAYSAPVYFFGGVATYWFVDRSLAIIL